MYAIGAPQGLELSLSEGIVSQLRGGFPPIIQTTVAISPGSSGGGLFNKNGELVGITTFQLKEGQNLNFALPVEWVGLVAEKESSSTIGFDTKEKLEILYVISGPIHLGDEELSSWPPLHGMCFEADFTITTPVQKLFLRIETYGLEIPVPIFLNNQKVASLPPQAIRFGKARPNEWSKDRIIEIPNKNLVNGINRIIICTDLVGKPQFPGDKDDFQFRNFRLIAE